MSSKRKAKPRTQKTTKEHRRLHLVDEMCEGHSHKYDHSSALCAIAAVGLTPREEDYCDPESVCPVLDIAKYVLNQVKCVRLVITQAYATDLDWYIGMFSEVREKYEEYRFFTDACRALEANTKIVGSKYTFVKGDKTDALLRGVTHDGSNFLVTVSYRDTKPFMHRLVCKAAASASIYENTSIAERGVADMIADYMF